MTCFKCNKLETECYFDITIIYTDQQPFGFENWVPLIKRNRCRAIFPGKTSVDIRMFIDLNGNFDNISYTNFLVNRYKETF